MVVRTPESLSKVECAESTLPPQESKSVPACLGVFRHNVNNGETMNRLADTLKKEAHKGNNERGATMVEYAVMVALIVVVVIAAVRLLGTNVSTQLNSVATQVGTN